MNTHELKTDTEPFEASLRGDKPYEVRLNDRDYRVDDMLILRETANCGDAMRNRDAPLVYTGRQLSRIVTEVRSNYGMKEGWVILGCRKV